MRKLLLRCREWFIDSHCRRVLSVTRESSFMHRGGAFSLRFFNCAILQHL
jgi:hypothetical protein